MMVYLLYFSVIELYVFWDSCPDHFHTALYYHLAQDLDRHVVTYCFNTGFEIPLIVFQVTVCNLHNMFITLPCTTVNVGYTAEMHGCKVWGELENVFLYTV